MSYQNAFRPYEPGPAYAGLNTSGVLSRRFFAYLVDILAISVLVVLFSFLVTILGALTFGLGWILFGFLVPVTAILYSAVTVGGAGGGTVGMRMAGLRAIDSETGGPVGLLSAGAHALLFYVAAGTFLLLVFDVMVGLTRGDRRLGHDLLAGVILIRR
jgi:uncharacterized RDD family membrane protein YckC